MGAEIQWGRFGSGQMIGDGWLRTTANRRTTWVVASLGIAAIAAIDFASGVELRVFPLYYVPISLVAWRVGRSSALIAAALCTAAWLAANALAGMHLSRPVLWIANTFVQAASFAIVGFLIATLRDGLERERGLSRTDPLTSLLNGRAFYEEASRIVALCRRKERPATLAYVDLDGFKAVNDTLGHPAGDDLLRRVAALLQASTRPSDVCARLGGDEFALLLPEVEPAEARMVLERLRSLLADRFGSGPCPVTGSIGAVTFLAVPETLEDMVRAADSLMYAAKREGRNRLHIETAGATTVPFRPSD